MCLQQGLQECIQFCDLMVTGRLEEVLDSNKKLFMYPAINLRHLVVLLKKFKQAPLHQLS